MKGDRWNKLKNGIWDFNGDGRWEFRVKGFWKRYFQRKLRRRACNDRNYWEDYPIDQC